jgi:hypothetical protein
MIPEQAECQSQVQESASLARDAPKTSLIVDNVLRVRPSSTYYCLAVAPPEILFYMGSLAAGSKQKGPARQSATTTCANSFCPTWVIEADGTNRAADRDRVTSYIWPGRDFGQIHCCLSGILLSSSTFVQAVPSWSLQGRRRPCRGPLEAE